MAKEQGWHKPWSHDKIFQETYFCNVNRENDRVTKWVRAFYSQFVNHPMFDVNICFARIINQPSTLECTGFLESPSVFGEVRGQLENMQAAGEKVFGDAYIVSTNGRKMGKAQYIFECLLPPLVNAIGPGAPYPPTRVAPTLAAAHRGLTVVYGVASFMGGQYIGDLKNTPGHPLGLVPDRYTWSCPGPGSLRGLSWVYSGDDSTPVKATYNDDIRKVSEMLREQGCTLEYDMQDLQNCLCEFDKYMRILHGTGRSKRKYNGT